MIRHTAWVLVVLVAFAAGMALENIRHDGESVFASELQPGRYQFIPNTPTAWYGFRLDTATGAVWRTGLSISDQQAVQEQLVMEPIVDETQVGRFTMNVTYACNQPGNLSLRYIEAWYLVDTATGASWRWAGGHWARLSNPAGRD